MSQPHSLTASSLVQGVPTVTTASLLGIVAMLLVSLLLIVTNGGGIQIAGLTPTELGGG